MTAILLFPDLGRMTVHLLPLFTKFYVLCLFTFIYLHYIFTINKGPKEKEREKKMRKLREQHECSREESVLGVCASRRQAVKQKGGERGWKLWEVGDI